MFLKIVENELFHVFCVRGVNAPLEKTIKPKVIALISIGAILDKITGTILFSTNIGFHFFMVI
jgi:hypothetical protein